MRWALIEYYSISLIFPIRFVYFNTCKAQVYYITVDFDHSALVQTKALTALWWLHWIGRHSDANGLRSSRKRDFTEKGRERFNMVSWHGSLIGSSIIQKRQQVLDHLTAFQRLHNTPRGVNEDWSILRWESLKGSRYWITARSNWNKTAMDNLKVMCI